MAHRIELDSPILRQEIDDALRAGSTIKLFQNGASGGHTALMGRERKNVFEAMTSFWGDVDGFDKRSYKPSTIDKFIEAALKHAKVHWCDGARVLKDDFVRNRFGRPALFFKVITK